MENISSFPSKNSLSFSRTDEILLLLEDASDWCSGEEISKTFHISRAAISKHIAILRKDGHIIESATKKGHKLVAKNVKINSIYLKNTLKTRVLGKNDILIFESIGSSNQEAIIKALNSVKTGTLIIAENQENGRGTKKHTWFSAPRSLQFSIILDPKDLAIPVKTLTQATLSAIMETITEITSVKAGIKKPNDIMVNGKKIAGVLVETGYKGLDLEWIILGVGLNINTLKKEFPTELMDICTSLFIETNTFFDRTAFLAFLLEKLEEKILHFNKEKI